MNNRTPRNLNLLSLGALALGMSGCAAPVPLAPAVASVEVLFES